MKKPPVSPWWGRTLIQRSNGNASDSSSGNMLSDKFCACLAYSVTLEADSVTLADRNWRDFYMLHTEMGWTSDNYPSKAYGS